MNRHDTLIVLDELLKRSGVLHFTATEFIHERAGTPPVQMIGRIVPTAMILDDLRTDSRGKVWITSAYRSPAYNKQVGGAPKSQHMEFTAVDIVSENWTPEQVQEYLATHTSHSEIGLGRYDTFTHLDTRNWNNPVDQPPRW